MQSHCIQTKSIWHITKHKNMTYELDIFFSKENTTKITLGILWKYNKVYIIFS